MAYSNQVVNFQELFRQADEYAGIRHQSAPFRYVDTCEFDEMANEPGGLSNHNEDHPWWTKIKCGDSDFIISHSFSYRHFVPPCSPSHYSRKIRYNPSSHSLTSQEREPWERFLLFGHEWESNVCWGFTTVEDSEDSADILVSQNFDMLNGSWVKLIVWDYEQIEVFDGTIVEDDVPVIFSSVDDKFCLGAGDKTVSSFSDGMQSSNVINDPPRILFNAELEKKRPILDGETSTAANNGVGVDLGTKRVRADVSGYRRRKLSVPSVEHGTIAITHRCMGYELKELELRAFHRPILPKEVSLLLAAYLNLSNVYYCFSSELRPRGPLVPIPKRHCALPLTV